MIHTNPPEKLGSRSRNNSFIFGQWLVQMILCGIFMNCVW